MAKTLIDLHLHSTKSDGKLTPQQIVALLVKNKIGFAALTDHDTTAGSKEFARAAKKHGIKTIDGVEISTDQDGVGLHILGYGINPNDNRLLKLFKKQTYERRKVFEKYAALFKKAGFKIDKRLYKKFRKLKSSTQAHIFYLIWNLPENQKLCFEKYQLPKEKNMMSVFINSFMELPGQLAYAKKKNVLAKDAIRLIHQAGGIAAWAHPGVEIDFKNPGLFPKIFKKLLVHGIDGIEAYSLAESHTPKWTKHLNSLARKHKLLITAGSDDHDGKRIGKLTISPKHQKEIIKNTTKWCH